MTIALKPISPDAVPEALRKAERYRLLNEPWEARSICEDILCVNPDNQEAIILLVLAMTDELGEDVSEAEARRAAARLGDEYQREYYTGIIHERSAKATLRAGYPGCKWVAFEALQQAMHCFEAAEAVRPPGNDDALLRWNTCARMIMRDPSIAPRPEEKLQGVLGE